MKKQIMFYGPPGTGKTYRLKEDTLEYICPNLESELSEIEKSFLDFKWSTSDKMHSIRSLEKFYENNPNFLADNNYKPGKKPYRNLSSLNKLMKLFVEHNTYTLTKMQIIKENNWDGPSTYVQHERILTNFDLVEQNWSDRNRVQLDLNDEGKKLKDLYSENFEIENFPDRELPSFAINTLKEMLIGTTRHNMSLWKNTILSMLWLGLENGYVYKYKKYAIPTNIEKILLKKCCGYDNEDNDFLSWAIVYLQDLNLVDESEENDSRLKKYYLNKTAFDLIRKLKILEDYVDENVALEDTTPTTNDKRYMLYDEFKKRRTLINKLFDKYKNDNNKIKTVTFHSSFEYEDFIEGISVDCDNSFNNEIYEGLRYYYKSGVLKNFCYAALKNVILNGLKEIESEELGVDSKDEIYLRLTDWNSTYIEYKKYRNFIDWSNADTFVFIIDEINRGDLAKVFGETITLVENDKRLGSKNEITINLPFTQHEFGIPNNIIFLCTMNTSDRSISTIDMALRRRFHFIPCKPNFDLISEIYYMSPTILPITENLLFKSAKALDALNKILIEVSFIGIDKLIGHSVLMIDDVIDDEQIMEAWKYDILPILEEHFYGQFEVLKDLLEYEGDFIDINYGFDKNNSTHLLEFIDFMVS